MPLKKKYRLWEASRSGTKIYYKAIEIKILWSYQSNRKKGYIEEAAVLIRREWKG